MTSFHNSLLLFHSISAGALPPTSPSSPIAGYSGSPTGCVRLGGISRHSIPALSSDLFPKGCQGRVKWRHRYCWGTNQWRDGRPPPELLDTRCKFQRTGKWMASFVHPRGIIREFGGKKGLSTWGPSLPPPTFDSVRVQRGSISQNQVLSEGFRLICTQRKISGKAGERGNGQMIQVRKNHEKKRKKRGERIRFPSGGKRSVGKR